MSATLETLGIAENDPRLEQEGVTDFIHCRPQIVRATAYPVYLLVIELEEQIFYEKFTA